MSELKWIKHDGGPMPVPGDTEVMLRWNETNDDQGPYTARHSYGWQWTEQPKTGQTITEYAIVTPSPSATDTVDAPTHYTAGAIECIDAIRAALTPDEFRGYCKGSMLKYTWHERGKGGDEDLRKAARYASFLTDTANG